MATNRVGVMWRAAGSEEPAKTAQFEAVFREYWPRIYGVLTRLVGDREEAQDLALETFWRFYSDPPSSNTHANVGGWLYRVATRLGLNTIRARRRREHYEFQAGRWEAEADSRPAPDGVAETVAGQEERDRVRRALESMNPDHAQLLLLRHSGFSYRELAQSLGLSPNSVGPLLVRAEREFERAYGEVGGDE